MQRKRQAECGDEPAVTFELEEAPRAQRGGRAGAAGAAAMAGVGLVSSAAASGSDDSLDVFDQADDATDAGGVPVTSYQALIEADSDPEFPPIDFAATDASAAAAGETFGASAEVGGGFVLDATAGDEAFGAPDLDTDFDVEPVSDTLLDDGHLDEHPDLDDDDPEDFELS
jgi:hypothetical protein